MAMKCANCRKGVLYGHNVSHAKNRTRKVFKPNLHSTRMTIGGTPMRIKLCTKCLRTFKRNDVLEKQKNAASSAVTPAPVTTA